MWRCRGVEVASSLPQNFPRDTLLTTSFDWAVAVFDSERADHCPSLRVWAACRRMHVTETVAHGAVLYVGSARKVMRRLVERELWCGLGKTGSRFCSRRER